MYDDGDDDDDEDYDYDYDDDYHHDALLAAVWKKPNFLAGVFGRITKPTDEPRFGRTFTRFPP